MKKFLSIVLVLLLVLAQIPIVGMATAENETKKTNNETDVIVTKVETDSSSITEGDKFELTITVEADSSQNISNIYIGLGNASSFILIDSGSKKLVNENYKVTFKLKYNGGNSPKVPITIYYKNANDEQYTISDYVDVPNIVPSSTIEEPEKIDETKIIPALAIVSSKTITGEAGRSTYLPITVKNTSNNYAEDITVTAEIDGASPLNLDGSGYESISRLASGRSKDIDLRISIDKYAESKTYPVKINFQFYNRYDIPFTSSETIYVKVENKNTKPLVSISKVDVNPKVSVPGKPTSIGLKLKNNGTLDAKDIKVSLGGISNDTFTLSSGFNSKYIEKIPGGKSSNVDFEITPSDKIAGGFSWIGYNFKLQRWD